MKLLTTIALVFPVALTAIHENQRGASAGSTASDAPSNDSQPIKVLRGGSQCPSQANADFFTGSVHIEPLFQAINPSQESGARVTFEPGARTKWHTHPLGQVLIVTSGTGWVQKWGDPVQIIRPGDVIRIPPGVKHWHGATATTSMTHVAIVAQLNGKTVDWMEKVSDEQYRGPRP